MNPYPIGPNLSAGFSVADHLAPEAGVARNWTKKEWEAFYQSPQYEELMKRSWECKTQGSPFLFD